MSDATPNPFGELIAELTDGERWRLVRSDGWDDFVARLSAVIADLEPARRQAMVMMLLALVDGGLTPERLQAHLDAEDTDSEEGVAALLGWLRQFRPRFDA